MIRVVSEPGGVSGVVLYEAVDAAGAPIPGPRAAVIARMHGNEPLGDPVLARLAEVVDGSLVAGSVLAVRANERAAALDRRHTEEGSDLNRLWDAASLERLDDTPREAMSYEEARAHELAPWLRTADALLDLHSTSRPAAPFLVLRDDQRHASIALRLGVRNLVTGVHENGVLSGGMAANLGLWPGERGARLGFVFEAGQHTDPANGARAWEVTRRFLSLVGVFPPLGPGDEAGVDPEIFEITDRFVQSPAGVEPYRFVGYQGGEPGAGRRGLPVRQLHSFEEICADEMILRRGPEVVRAETPFTMLMPAPTTPPGTDLYYVAQPRHGGLTFGTFRSDEDARREAMAIERALDLVADDEFERGATWVAFDTRRLFDLCALVVARQSRLEAGDPHRRITVVGRGDHGLEDSDRRAGQRYRHAMKAVLAEGMRVERVQLLRGAPMAWLDALTGPSMCELLAARERRTGTDAGVTLRFSLTHPHSVSLLVAGDVDRALQTGDVRKVRVVLLVEAATVEADGPGAAVRVVRAGFVSARREVLAAASRMLQGLRADHRWLVEHGPLRADPSVAPLQGPDGEIVASCDPVRMGGLRDALRRVVWRSWVERLRPEVVDGHVLADEAERGRWLADLLRATGILDPAALERSLLRPDGAGFRVDATALDQELPVEAPPSSETRGMASVPALFAHEVTADDLERWVGFVRFVRSVQVVPGTRGKDLDLLFDAPRIRARLVGWFGAARALAGDRRVVVVVAGDGLRDDPAVAELALAHQRLIEDPRVDYLRIQHAQSASLPWLRTLVGLVSGRAGAAVRFEVEHGSTVNVVVVATAAPGRAAGRGDDPLAGADVIACAVVLSDLASQGSHVEEVALFTDGLDGDPPCPELVAFGRAHCARLSHGGAEPDLEAAVLAQLTRWIERVRIFRPVRDSLPADLAARGRWVSRRFGIADPALARAVAAALDDDRPAREVAQGLWT